MTADNFINNEGWPQEAGVEPRDNAGALSNPSASKSGKDNLFLMNRRIPNGTYGGEVRTAGELITRLLPDYPALGRGSGSYQTRQGAVAAIAWPLRQPKAAENSGMFTATPFTRVMAGGCGSLSTSMRRAASV